MDYTNTNIGNNILAIIKEKGINVNQFANDLGISIKSLGRILDGRVIISDDLINKVVAVLGVPCDALYVDNADIYAYHRKQFDNQEHYKKINQIINDYINLVEQIK